MVYAGNLWTYCAERLRCIMSSSSPQVQVEKIKHPEEHIAAVLERAKAEYIQKTYRIPAWSSPEDFLEKLAFRTGKLHKVSRGRRHELCSSPMSEGSEPGDGLPAAR